MLAFLLSQIADTRRILFILLLWVGYVSYLRSRVMTWSEGSSMLMSVVLTIIELMDTKVTNQLFNCYLTS
jgi:hypothetical protein